MIIEGNKITAEEGMLLLRKSDSECVGTEYYLGYIYYLGGKKLDTPYLEVPEDFCEKTPDDLYPLIVEALIRRKYTISDELALQRQRETKLEAFQEYFDFCEECKDKAKRQLGLVE